MTVGTHNIKNKAETIELLLKYLSHVCDIQGGQLLILDSHLIEQESQWVQRR